ncbi:MAG: hypothetical protein IJ493_10325 [Clostridia bacterium]|nr:hypothetical protein [Clostridia bacterium]
MMKKSNLSWEGVYDPTGYMFSFAKSLTCAVKNSAYADLAEDVVAVSGFAFRMWVSPDLCPSATSIWQFDRQKPWVEMSGLRCEQIDRLWGQDAVEEAKRLEALALIRRSIDGGTAVVSWDIGVCEWGLIIGYDDETETLATLPITGTEGTMPYVQLGKRELPILNVLAITGCEARPADELLAGTMKLAASHLRGEEWCDNAKGLAAYPALIGHYEAEDKTKALSWNMEYFLGTYAPLKWYAWKFFEKYGRADLADCYRRVHECWMEAFSHRREPELAAAKLREAETLEREALAMMEA